MFDAFFSRRRFLTRGVQLLSAASTIPLFLDRSAHVLADAHPVVKNDQRVLVVVQLAGGNDGLNTIIPVTSDAYYKARPKLGIARDKSLKLDDSFHVHPQATGFKKLYDAGLLSVLHAVGYPNPNRSHFRSTDIWASGEPAKIEKSGWLGRYCDACCAGEDPGTKKKMPPDPATAIALAGDPPRTLVGGDYVPLSFGSPETLGFNKADADGTRAAFDKLNDADHEAPSTGPGMQPGAPGGDDNAAFLQRSALNARLAADRIRKATAAGASQASYPNSALARDLKLIAQMIASELPTRIYYAKIGGFDTHSGQAGRHGQLLAELSNALAAFMDDLKGLGHQDRVTVMTFSEFGRRVKENGSGTDHGEAAPMFLMGPRLQPGLHGTFPSLAPDRLNRGDVPYTTDFRSVYATILKDFLGVDETKVLGKGFKTLKLYRT